MKIIKETVLVIEDFSALGQISMVAALTVFQAMNYTTAALPTTILSTQTEGFGSPQRINTTNWLTKTIHHWHQVPDLTVSGTLIGYLGQKLIADQIVQLLDSQTQTSPVVIDPVMGDEGALYPGLDLEYVAAIRRLCQQATVITPNWTELCLLTNTPLDFAATREHAQQLVHQLPSLGIDAQVVITGIEDGCQTGCLVQPDRKRQEVFVGNPKLAGHFYGTGDTFAALLLGWLLRDASLQDAVHHATRLVYTAIQATFTEETPLNRKYGLKLGKLVEQLTTESNDL